MTPPVTSVFSEFTDTSVSRFPTSHDYPRNLRDSTDIRYRALSRRAPRNRSPQ